MSVLHCNGPFFNGSFLPTSTPNKIKQKLKSKSIKFKYPVSQTKDLLKFDIADKSSLVEPSSYCRCEIKVLQNHASAADEQ